MSTYGALTSQDMQDSMNFAVDQVNRLKCEDINIRNHMCGEGSDCITYKEEDYRRTWPTPMSVNPNKACADYTYDESNLVGAMCYQQKTSEVDESENDLDPLYPFCINTAEGDFCGWDKSDVVDRLKVTSGTCVANNEDTCLKFSRYKNKEIVRSDGEFKEVGTSRDRQNNPKKTKGTCEPAACDPDCDDNCLPRVCQSATCKGDVDCRDEGNKALPGFTGECNPTSLYGNGFCVVDKDYVCNENEDCSALGKPGVGSCEIEGRYDLDKIDGGIHKDCWEEREGDYDGKKCDSEYVVADACYGQGACPIRKVPNGVNQVYLEWNVNAGKCDDKSTCKNGLCIDGSCTCEINGDCPGSSTCLNGKCTAGGQCVYGNELLREFCEEPQCRPEQMMEGAYNNNNTLPPWAYDKTRGTCNISRRFCAYGYMPYGIAKKDWIGNDYLTLSSDTDKIYSGDKKVDGCTDDSDCASYGDGDWKCMDDYDSYNKKQGIKSCSGPGAQCASDNFGDMTMKNLFGETLYNSMKYGETCWAGGGMTERYTSRLTGSITNHLKGMDKNAEVASVAISKHLITSAEVVSKDVIPGLDLFRTKYANGTEGVGFSIDQAREVIPDLVKATPKGDEYILIRPDQKYESPEATKLYFLLTMKIK